MIYAKYILVLIFVFSFSGCVSLKQETVENLFKTHNSIEVNKDSKKIAKYLIQLKKKIDLRNPKAFDKELSNDIYTQIDSLENSLNLNYLEKEIDSYKSYMQIAFSKDAVKNRNDFLILGIYKNFYEAYSLDSGYKPSAFSYDLDKLQTLYHNLQIVSWKLKTNKDLNGEYLFLTWQNNWQVELERKVKNGQVPTWEDIQNLKYIKSGEEDIFGYSNFSYEHVLLQMKNRVGMSIERLGSEPTDMGINTIKSVFIFL